VDANLFPSTTTATYDVMDSGGNVAQGVTVPFFPKNGPNGGRIDSGTGVILNGESVVNAWYHGLVVTVRRPMSHGVELLFNYTFSKSIDDGAVPGAYGTFYGTDAPLNPYNLKQENALSDLDQRHRFVGSVVFAPTWFRHISNTPARLVLDGWSLSNINTLASGQPITGLVNGFPSNGVDGGVTGGLVSNAASPTGGRIPQLGRNTFQGPHLYNVDLRLARAFTFRERYQFQIRGEAFNLFNHTNIASLNTTAYNYVAAGKSGCTAAGTAATNGCLVPSPTFLTPTSSTSTNGLYGARQLQISARFVF
jgi:hypothetical protein